MKRTPLLLVTVLPLLLAAGIGNRDVNRDGRVNLADVKALGRMVAGLDSRDLSFDQDGDGALTLKDVNILYSSVSPEEPGAADAGTPATSAPARSQPTPTPTSRAAGTSALFLVVEQATDGKIVVVVGAKGVKPGDRILAIYPTLAEADAHWRRVTGGEPLAVPRGRTATATPFPTRTPTPMSPTPTPLPTRSPDTAPAIPELAGTVAVTPLAPGQALLSGPGWREGWVLRIDPGAGGAVILRRRRLDGLVRLKGPLTRPCALFDSRGRPAHLFTYLPARGEGRIFKGLLGGGPLHAVRVTMTPNLEGKSGRMLVLPRRDKRGATTAGYLYHWPTGTALYVPGLGGGAHRFNTSRVQRFPATVSKPLAVPVRGRAGATRSFVILDPASGGAWCILDVRPHPRRPRPISTAVNLLELARPGVPGGISLAAAPLVRPDGSSSRALIVEAGSGRLALLQHDDDPAAIRLEPLSATIDDVFPTRGGTRRLFAVPLARPDAVLLVEGSSGRLASVTVAVGGAVTVKPLTVAQ